MKPTDFRFFLDSGAFSAWSRGSVIDLDEYIEFIRGNIEFIDVYANLDCIPGTPGKVATPAQRDQAAQQSWDNYQYMKNAGLDPLPVYHYGEDLQWLFRMIDDGATYIGIGGLVGIPSRLRRLWLDRVFTEITDSKGMPTIRTHGFGMTSIPLVFRYPWYSVDSSSWIKVTQSGNLYIPANEEGRFVFDRTPSVVSVSDRSPNTMKIGKHSNSFGDQYMELMLKWLDECGVTYEEVRSHYGHRATCNATFFRKVSEQKAITPFSHRVKKQDTLF